MSYDIVYNRQFLRADEKIVPLVLIGCNNLWETNYYGKSQRRVRDWNPLFNGHNSIPLMTESEIMERAKECTGGEYQEHFKRGSKWVDDKAFLAFCKNGIKSAATLEQLQEMTHSPDAVYVRCHLSIWYTDDKNEQRNTTDLSRTIRTTEELLAYMDEAAQRLASRKPNETSVYVCVEFPYEKAVEYPKEIKRRKPAERLESDYWVVLVNRKSGDSYYIRKLTKSLHLAYTATGAKQFKTESAAEKWVNERSIKSRFQNIDSVDFQYVA